MHIRFRRSILLKLALAVLLTFLSTALLLVIARRGKTDPELAEKVLGFDSLPDFIVSNLGGILVGLVVAGALLLLIRAAFFSQRFRGPVFALREALHRVEDGDLAERLAVEPASELAELADDFNAARDALAARFRRVREAVTELEAVHFDLQRMRVDNRLGVPFLVSQLERYRTELDRLKESLAAMNLPTAFSVPRILVIGGGGREHALVHALAASPAVETVYAAPGNPGIAALATCVAVPVAAPFDGLVAWCREERIDLVVVGPEQPLVDGVADALAAAGIPVFGPDKSGARLEGSKGFAKRLMAKYGIPTAAYGEFGKYEDAVHWLEARPGPYVLKADGLAAGKGVHITESLDDAKAMLKSYMVDGLFGDASRRVVLEEFLTGEEASILAVVDASAIKPLPAAQDHKRVNDGDSGPNTGGMGAYAPAPVVTPEVLERVRREILEPMRKAFRKEKIAYRGILYVGLMIGADGPKVIEFNCRFGDPETQVVVPLLRTDLAEIAWAAAHDRLAGLEIATRDGAAACVVLASGGYPGPFAKGLPIDGLDLVDDPAVRVYHAGTVRDAEGRVVTAGGRVLGVTAVQSSLANAIAKAYGAVEHITFAGRHYRSDIGERGLARAATSKERRP